MRKYFFAIAFYLVFQALKAQNVGIGTNIPSEKLDIVGNIKAINPDGIAPGDTFVLVTDSAGRFRRIPKSSLLGTTQTQPTNSSGYPTDLFSFHYQITGNGNQASGSLYMDSFYIPAFLTSNMAFSVYSPKYGTQSRTISNDWADVDGIGSIIISKQYTYTNMFNSGQFGGNSELRVYRYLTSNFSVNPGIMKFQGLIPTPSTNLQNPTMIFNGEFMYFNKNTGTTNNIYSFSKYRISNDTFHYVSTITLSQPPPFSQSTQIFAIAIDNQENFYVLLDATRKIIRFNNSGSFTGSIQGSIASNIRGILNWNNRLYLANDALGFFQNFIFH